MLLQKLLRGALVASGARGGSRTRGSGADAALHAPVDSSTLLLPLRPPRRCAVLDLAAVHRGRDAGGDDGSSAASLAAAATAAAPTEKEKEMEVY